MQVMSNSNTVKSFVLQTLFITGKEKIMMNAAVKLFKNNCGTLILISNTQITIKKKYV